VGRRLGRILGEEPGPNGWRLVAIVGRQAGGERGQVGGELADAGVEFGDPAPPSGMACCSPVRRGGV
jgi:uncharacterized protein DUF4332